MIDPRKPLPQTATERVVSRPGLRAAAGQRGPQQGPQGPGSRDIPRSPLDRVRCRLSSVSTSIWGERKAVSVLSCWQLRDGFPLEGVLLGKDQAI